MSIDNTMSDFGIQIDTNQVEVEMKSNIDTSMIQDSILMKRKLIEIDTNNADNNDDTLYSKKLIIIEDNDDTCINIKNENYMNVNNVNSNVNIDNDIIMTQLCYNTHNGIYTITCITTS